MKPEKHIAAKPKHGFVLGKFMPPHKGHVFLCNFAQEYCKKLTILVCSLPDEPIPGVLRYLWMKQMFPNCNVLWCREVLPQYPEEHPDFWQIWNDVIKRHHSEPVDVVFASENYGDRLAKDLNAQFVPCDISRETVPISGTQIRQNPGQYWHYIPDVVKPYYSKRICMIGVESTGKTTLAKEIVTALPNSVYLPEYGRTYTEFFGADVDENDMTRIVQGHLASRKALERENYQYIIEDTDPVMSAVWSDILTGGRDPWFNEFDDYADLYILCDIDLPWVDDGTRYFKNDVDRRRFHAKVLQELETRKLPYITVSGKGKERSLRAISEIKYNLLNE